MITLQVEVFWSQNCSEDVLIGFLRISKKYCRDLFCLFFRSF